MAGRHSRRQISRDDARPVAVLSRQENSWAPTLVSLRNRSHVHRQESSVRGSCFAAPRHEHTVKYKQCMTRPVRVQPVGCGCGDTSSLGTALAC